jgi:hypothetical protein
MRLADVEKKIFGKKLKSQPYYSAPTKPEVKIVGSCAFDNQEVPINACSGGCDSF